MRKGHRQRFQIVTSWASVGGKNLFRLQACEEQDTTLPGPPDQPPLFQRKFSIQDSEGTAGTSYQKRKHE